MKGGNNNKFIHSIRSFKEYEWILDCEDNNDMSEEKKIYKKKSNIKLIGESHKMKYTVEEQDKQHIRAGFGDSNLEIMNLSEYIKNRIVENRDKKIYVMLEYNPEKKLREVKDNIYSINIQDIYKNIEMINNGNEDIILGMDIREKYIKGGYIYSEGAKKLKIAGQDEESILYYIRKLSEIIKEEKIENKDGNYNKELKKYLKMIYDDIVNDIKIATHYYNEINTGLDEKNMDKNMTVEEINTELINRINYHYSKIPDIKSDIKIASERIRNEKIKKMQDKANELKIIKNNIDIVQNIFMNTYKKIADLYAVSTIIDCSFLYDEVIILVGEQHSINMQAIMDSIATKILKGTMKQYLHIPVGMGKYGIYKN